MAKKDLNGTLITAKKMLEKLYLDTYVEWLKPNKIAPELENLERLKEYLFSLRYDWCKTKKTLDWNSDGLEKSLKLKSMKNNKARDAHGHIYEIFKFVGNYLKDSLLKMLNNIKKKQIYPDISKPSNITPLYKKKGEKSDLYNVRGVFDVVKVRSILNRMVHNDKYSIIDENMSSSNIGGRKKRNIRDHLFVINSILMTSSSTAKKTCFDKMWSSETETDLPMPE